MVLPVLAFGTTRVWLKRHFWLGLQICCVFASLPAWPCFAENRPQGLPSLRDKGASHETLLAQAPLGESKNNSAVAEVAAMRPDTSRPTLAILAKRGVLDFKTVRAFEDKYRVNVRVDFVSNNFEYEARLRASPFAWDVVVASEQRLHQLHFARLLRALPNWQSSGEENALATRGRGQEAKTVVVPLLVDPMVIFWNPKALPVKARLTSLAQLLDYDKFPLLRNRIDLPETLQAQFLLAGLHSGHFWSPNDASLAAAFGWLRAARAQAKFQGLTRSQRFFSQRVVAGGGWLSEVMRLRNVTNDLEFALPTSGTLFERIGVAITAEATHEKLAEKLVAHLRDSRKGLSFKTGFFSVLTSEFQPDQSQNWRYIDEVLPLEKAVQVGLEKMQD